MPWIAGSLNGPLVLTVAKYDGVWFGLIFETGCRVIFVDDGTNTLNLLH